jgi:molecular chaperone GrpE
MKHPTNGRKIKIPVKKIQPQLPDVEDARRPMLTGPSDPEEQKTLADVEQTSVPESVKPAKDWQREVAHWRAEAEKARRRSERRAAASIQEERHRLLRRLLTVADNLEHAMQHADPKDQFAGGVQLVLDDLLRQLAHEGVEPISALGQPFDPTLHEAIGADGSGGDTVIEVLQTGYMLSGGLLRPAKVVVGSDGASDLRSM